MTGRTDRRALLLGALLAVAALAILISIFSAGYFPVQADETDVAWVAKQVAMGRAPYGDFFSFIPPLTLYGLGAFFKAVGPSLAALRLLTVAWLTGLTLLCHLLLLRWKVPAGWAFGAALSLPALFLPFWPVPSHHWFAMGFGLLSLAALSGPRRSPRNWFYAGGLVGLSGLCLQTEGLFFAAMLVLLLLTDEGGPKGRSAFWASAGLALPLLLFGFLLLLSGTAGWAFYDLVLWPARYYKQTGGFNDVKPLQFLPALWRDAVPRPFRWTGLAPLALLSLCMALPALALLLPGFSPVWTGGRREGRGEWLVGAGGILLAFLLYVNGRGDWTHLVMISPLLLLFTARSLDWTSERWRPGAMKAWIAAALVLAAVRWPAYWIQRPPILSQVAAVDARLVRESVPAVLGRLPGVLEKKLPVLYLSSQGSALYLYWAPVPPPVDWLMPPSSRYNAPWEYAMAARFAQEHRVPYILISANQHAAFLTDPSPVRDLLKDHYRPYLDTPWGKVLERIPDGAPAP